ncbi:MAG: hypothetical protein ACRCUM_01335 [Mycoplasmoidaceae bacterium]
MNKKIKLLSLSFLSAMVITPVIALGGNFYNDNEVNIANEVDELGRAVNSKTIFSEELIKKSIKELNDDYDNTIANDKYQDKYFTENGFEIGDFNLKFELDGNDIEMKQNLSFSNSDGGMSVDNLLLNDGSISSNPSNVKFQEGGKNHNGGIVGSNHNGTKKDPDLKLKFSNSTKHRIVEKNYTNQFGHNQKIDTTYNSDFSLDGKLAPFDQYGRPIEGNQGSWIVYSRDGIRSGYKHYILKAKQPYSNDPYLYNDVSNFFKGSKLKPIIKQREIDVFYGPTIDGPKGQHWNNDIINFVFQNNYLPEISNAKNILNQTELKKQGYGKLWKFSDNFKNLQLIKNLKTELDVFKTKLETAKESGKINNQLILENLELISINIDNSMFSNNISNAIEKLEKINKSKWEDNSYEFQNLISDFVNNILGHKPFNSQIKDVLVFARTYGLIYNDVNVDGNEIVDWTSNLGVLYDRIIKWLSVIEIELTINGGDYVVFANGEIKDLSEVLPIFNDEDRSVEKSFNVSSIKINKRKPNDECDGNVFVVPSITDRGPIGIRNSSNLSRQYFLTWSNTKIAYSKNFKGETEDIKQNKLERSIPIDSFTENLSTYLKKDDNGNVGFVDEKNEGVILKDIKKNISDLFDETSLFNYEKYRLYKGTFIFDEDLINFLDLPLSINNYSNEELNDLVFDTMINRNFNDNDGVFYSLAIIPNWNGEEVKVGNETYINHYKKKYQEDFIKNINKNGTEQNILEIEPRSSLDNNGYFLLKCRTKKNLYVDNALKYLEVMENFETYFIPIIEEVSEEDKIIEKVVGYKRNPNLPSPWNIIEEDFYKNIEEIAERSADEIFDYENIIFNQNNIKYKNEIKDVLDEIAVKVENNKAKYLPQEIPNPIVPSKEESINIGLVVGITIPLFIVAVVGVLVFVKFMNDKKLNKEIGQKQATKSNLFASTPSLTNNTYDVVKKDVIQNDKDKIAK